MKLSLLATTILLSAVALTNSNPLSKPSSKPFGVVPKEVATSIVESHGPLATAQGPVPLSQSASVDAERDAPLLKDIQMLNDLLEEIVKKENPKVHDLYTSFHKLGLDRAGDTNDTASLDSMIQCAKDLSPENALRVMRTFSLMLNLVNAAETHHRLRVMRQSELKADMDPNLEVGPLPLTEDSMRGTIDAILKAGDATKDEIFNQLMNQKVEIVLTAHPTEVNRKTLLRKFREISETLAYLERPDLHPYEKSEKMSSLRRIIASIWGSDEIRRQKPTPQKEAAGGNAVIESVLWDAVPAYLRKLDAQCRISLNRRLPVDTVPIKFASWIGGDRDGNPNVTPEVTREVVTQQRLRAAKLFLVEINLLYNDLAISNRFSKELEELSAAAPESFDEKEKYRHVLGHLRQRLMKTVKNCEEELSSFTTTTISTASEISVSPKQIGWEEVEPIESTSELLNPLRVIYDSLVETGYESVAEGRLVDVIRRLAVFGTTLVPLDIREESTKHAEALDAITRWLGIG